MNFEPQQMEGTLIILGMVGIPCAAFLIFYFTAPGKEWLRRNNML